MGRRTTWNFEMATFNHSFVRQAFCFHENFHITFTTAGLYLTF